MTAVKNLTGQRFGRLTVIERAENRNNRACWKCLCDCGVECIVCSRELMRGDTKSCGCLHNEGNFFTHRMSNTKIFRIWSAMKTRCFNPNAQNFDRYGGRGITIYPKWIEDFQAFYDYVSKLEHYGETGYTLDRIDVNGNYEPNNLRWADRKTQGRNKRTNRIVEYNGESMTLAEAAEKSGINMQTLHTRICSGDSDEKLFRPLESGNAKLTENDVRKIRELFSTKQYNLKELAKMFRVTCQTILNIVNRKSWKNVL